MKLFIILAHSMTSIIIFIVVESGNLKIPKRIQSVSGWVLKSHSR